MDMLSNLCWRTKEVDSPHLCDTRLNFKEGKAVHSQLESHRHTACSPPESSPVPGWGIKIKQYWEESLMIVIWDSCPVDWGKKASKGKPKAHWAVHMCLRQQSQCLLMGTSHSRRFQVIPTNLHQITLSRGHSSTVCLYCLTIVSRVLDIALEISLEKASFSSVDYFLVKRIFPHTAYSDYSFPSFPFSLRNKQAQRNLPA